MNMDNNQIENIIEIQKQKASESVLKNLKKQKKMSAVLLIEGLAISGGGAYLLAVGNYALGGVLLGVGVLVLVAVTITHIHAVKRMKKILADLDKVKGE